MRVLGVVLLAAASALGGPGSVISSFDATASGGGHALGAYRDADFVYVVAYLPLCGNIEKFTPTGSRVDMNTLWPCSTVPEDPDNSFLGPAYYTIAAEGGLWTFMKEGGVFVRQDHGDLKEALGYGYLPGSPYYYIGVSPEESYPNPDSDDALVIYRFTTAGSLVSTFASSYAGRMGVADHFNGIGGEYIITSAGGVFTPAGSLVSTFAMDVDLYGVSVGPGYPASYGATLWGVKDMSPPSYCYQIDLGNGDLLNITPASLGKVKALFK